MNWLDFCYWMTRLNALYNGVTEPALNCRSPEDVAQALSNETNYVTFHPFKVGDYYDNVKLYYGNEIADKSVLNGDDVGNYIAFIASYDAADEVAVKSISDITYTQNIHQILYQCFWPSQVEYIPANQMNEAGTLPIVLVQVAAHAAGSAFFYHPNIIKDPPQSFSEQTVFGTSYDPTIGENIRFLAVVLIPSFNSDWTAPKPIQLFNTTEQMVQLLRRINNLN